MEAETIDHFTGRHGLLVPTLEAAKDRPELHEPSVIRFFYKLWKLNAKDPSTEHRYNGSEYKTKPYSHEIVLAAADQNPLIVIRGFYQPKGKAQLNYEMERDRERMPNNLGVEQGIERHSILLPPDQIGEFTPLLEVTDTHYYYSGSHSRPRSGISLKWFNQPIREDDFRPDISKIGTEISVPEFGQQTRERYSQFIGDVVLKETILLLS